VTEPKSSRRGTPTVPGEERRRSQRVMIRMPVTLHLTAAGKEHRVQATTVAVNDHGAMLLCARSFEAEQKFEIQNDRTRERTKCRVTRPPREAPEGYLVPIEFETSLPGFWHISFPPAGWKAVDD
jgi:hypothetical protein